MGTIAGIKHSNQMVYDSIYLHNTRNRGVEWVFRYSYRNYTLNQQYSTKEQTHNHHPTNQDRNTSVRKSNQLALLVNANYYLNSLHLPIFQKSCKGSGDSKNLKPHQQKEVAMRNEYQSSRGTIGLHAATSLPGDGNVQHDTVSGHMLLAVATEGNHLEEPPATDSKAEVSDNGFSPHLIVDSNGIFNENMVIDSECPTISAKDAEGDTLEMATDLKETSLSPNATVDTHFANAATDANNGISNANEAEGSRP